MARPTGPFSDSAIAARAVAELLTDRYVHVDGVGWLEWDGRVWRERTPKHPLELVRQWCRDQLADAAMRLASGTGLEATVKGWVDLQYVNRLTAIVKLAAGMVSLDPEKLDASPDVLNARNGIVHLPTGDLLPHNPAMYCTKIAGCDYVPTALHEDWNSALQAVRRDTVEWLQVRYGQAITGHMSPDDLMVIQQGGGANGKSTILMGVDRALGDYYYAASDKVLMGSHSTAHTTDLADLRGTRFVSIEELPEIGRLDAARLKKIVGTEKITARKMRQDNVVFPATHTLFVNTNYPPMVAETDDGTWRRLALVVFPYKFTEHPEADGERQGDPKLRARLRDGREGQHEAVLAWLVEGAVRWYESGRDMPPLPLSVQMDTAEWHDRTDHVASFWNDHLDVDPDSYVYAGDLIWLFNNFMDQHGYSRLAESTFLRRFYGHPLVRDAGLVRRQIRQGPAQTLVLSRPFGALDPFSRLPGVPAGQIQAYVGIRFRSTNDTLDDSVQDHTKGRDL